MPRYLIPSLAVVAALALVQPPALAHDHGPSHGHGHGAGHGQERQDEGAVHRAHRGGDIQHIGEKHLELVLEDGKLCAYLTDEKNQALSGENVRVTGMVITGGGRNNVTFSHTGGNRFEAKEGGFRDAKDLRAVLTVILPGDETHRARFHLTR